MSDQLAEALETKMGEKSLRQLARDLDVAVGTAEGWLKGWRSPDLKHIQRLAVYLNIPVGDIVAWELEALDGAKGVWLRSEFLATA